MTKLEFLPKRRSYNTITIDNSKPVTQSMSHPSLPHYTNVTSKSDTYQLTFTPLDNTETETLVKMYSKTKDSFPPTFQHRSFSTFLLVTPIDHLHLNLTVFFQINVEHFHHFL